MWPFLGPSGKVISRSAEASTRLASSVFRKAIVLAMRALSSANVFSLSSNPGGSTPASRAAAFLAWSQALCNLARECEHIREEARVEQRRRIDPLCFRIRLCLVEKRRERVETDL